MIKDIKLEATVEYIEDVIDIITALNDNYIIEKYDIKVNGDKNSKNIKVEIVQGGNE